MPLYQVAIPAIVVAHVIGLALLLYSLEKVSGIVSRTTRKLSWKKKKANSPSSAAAAAASAEAGRVNHSVRSLQPSPTKSIHNTVKSKGWVRGCACTVSWSNCAFEFFFFFSLSSPWGEGRKKGKEAEREQPCRRQLGEGIREFRVGASCLFAPFTSQRCCCGTTQFALLDGFRAVMARVELWRAAERAREDWRNTEKKEAPRATEERAAACAILSPSLRVQ